MQLLTWFVLLCSLSSVFCDEVVLGNVRIQTLSPTLLRVENIGPLGFEDRTTFMVTNRIFDGVPILSVDNATGTVITKYYTVKISHTETPTDKCFGQEDTDADNAQRSPSYPNGVATNNQGSCCETCHADPDCNGWVFASALPSGSVNCWPLNAWSSTHTAGDRLFGCLGNSCVSVITSITVSTPAGQVLWNSAASSTDNMLHWPSPLTAQAYLLTDFPRFHVPAWGPTPHFPISQFPETNGYDFTNNQNGDNYIFLLGNTLESWFEARAEFVKLVGPTPLIPDFAFGTWFTYWYSYTEAEAKSDVANFQKGGLPLAVYGLDMNWRNTSNLQDHFYSHANTALFPNFTEWFSFLHANGLKTYFNDHPFPVDWQTSPSEVGFRYGGLSEWMERGLDYWWFDHNWAFSIPPPNVYPVNGWSVSNTDGNWLGLDNAAWGSHVYFESVSQFYKAKGSNFRPITLTKFARPDWKPDMASILHAEHPAHHRFPVWWTGDGVDLKASIQSMVDSGVHDFKPYVHSDCGGDYRGSAGDLIRWTEHCVFGTILRFHGSDHRPWTYDSTTESVIKKYLVMRYKLIPSFIAAGQGSLWAGFPIAARGDVFWPTHPEAADNTQYIHLNTTLVAPIWDSSQNITARSVWLPPGQWQDAWDGSIITGPQTTSVSKPFEQIPMWHKRGSFMVTVDSPALRIEEQDWSVLTLEAFPDIHSTEVVHQSLFSLESAAHTALSMASVFNNGVGLITFKISPAEDGASRGWVVRLHLLSGQRCLSAVVDGHELEVNHLAPVSVTEQFFPFAGVGSQPAHKAGAVAEIQVPQDHRDRILQVKVVYM